MKNLILLIVVLSLAFCQLLLAYPVKIISHSSLPLSNSIVEIIRADGSKATIKADIHGKIYIKEVPQGIVKIVILQWKSIPINAEYVVTLDNNTIICDKVGLLVVNVLGQRDQSISNARIIIVWNNKIVEIGKSNKEGSYTTLLPEGNYTIIVYYDKFSAKKNVTVIGGTIDTIKVKLNVYVILAGIALSLVEFIGLIITVVLVIVIIYIIIYEYMLWRKRKLVKAIISAKVTVK